MDGIVDKLVKEFSLKLFQVENVVKLIDDGCTIPFIARYRKEMTGELNDQVIRELNDRLEYLRNLETRRADVIRLIDEQGKLSEEINKALLKAINLQEIEDIYRPFKPKRRTKATIAKEKGLEPFAKIIYAQETNEDIKNIALKYIDNEKGVNNIEEAIGGALDIIAEDVSDNAEFRKVLREKIERIGNIVSISKKEEDSVYRMYYDFKEPISKIAKHRVLAINRGEKEEFLGVSIDVQSENLIKYLEDKIIKNKNSQYNEYLVKAIGDAYKRLIFPSLEREVRSSLTENSQEQAIKVFAENLRNLLLQPPVKDHVVLGLDPAYRTGCKLAVVDDTGKVLYTGVIYPTPPQNKVDEAKKVIKELIKKYDIDLISIGNGTASKESEIFISELLKEIDKEIYYMVVSEAGASVYSASKLGAIEFPDFDVALRSAVSIARRLQDPLAELVKIDPKSIGVGQYQHDMNQKKLDESLKGVVEFCVNSVGVDVNTASPSLLSYVSGINASVAKNIVEYRESNGKFLDRKQLLKVKKLGEKAFVQCAGFLKIQDSKNILDNTAVHPESYNAVVKLLNITGYSMEDVKERKLGNLLKEVEAIGIQEIADKVGIGVPTLRDIINEMLKPGRDPRDELPKPILLSDVMDIKDLKSGMIMQGTVRNVADFGAFVDIGVHQDGLVHISELCNRFIRNPMEVVSVGDIVQVKILSVDIDKKRISLSMKDLS